MSAPALRPLPARPNLEHEKKQAKALLRRLHAGEPEALARAAARDTALGGRAPHDFQLADAQLVLAREYGFTSWPRLVRWFGDVDRQSKQVHARRYMSPDRRHVESLPRWFRSGHASRDPHVGRALAVFVPRFYGLAVDEVFAQPVSDEELRLAAARLYAAPSWQALLERVEEDERFRHEVDWRRTANERAARAIRDVDLPALQAVFAEHPQLREAARDAQETGNSPMTSALFAEQRLGRERLQPIVDWLTEQGFDMQRTLDIHLLGHMAMETETVRWLLERGADPNWIAPNGFSVLEHAVLRWWSGAAVDLLLAGGARPRPALWIAAGTGDVAGMRAFLDRDGLPIEAVRRDRPDFHSTTRPGWPQLPEPGDEELLVEALFVAVLNDRANVIAFLAAHGVPIDSLVYGTPLSALAAGNGFVVALEALIRAGANPDLGGPDGRTARGMARELAAQTPDDPKRRRIAELCEIDVAAARREREAHVRRPEGMAGSLTQAIELAGDDAVRRGRGEVDVESLAYGLLRAETMSRMVFARVAKVDVDRLFAEQGERLRPVHDRVVGPVPASGASARAALDAATAIAREEQHEILYDTTLLLVLARDPDGTLAHLLARYGGNREALLAELEKGTEPRHLDL